MRRAIGTGIVLVAIAGGWFAWARVQGPADITAAPAPTTSATAPGPSASSEQAPPGQQLAASRDTGGLAFVINSGDASVVGQFEPMIKHV